MNKNAALACLALSLFAALPSCRSAESKETRAQREQKQTQEMMAQIPADSPLAKLKPGMSESEVVSLIGRETSQGNHITGKQFIPFNFAAKDTMRTVYYYKGIGRVEFSSGSWGQRNGVINIVSDTNEPGFGK
ncbi:MAG TPA: hypothetical protein VM509_14710 [Planctomycetota bacterium]|nr:hypothetical protein [Planctomycetota bacterium]